MLCKREVQTSNGCTGENMTHRLADSEVYQLASLLIGNVPAPLTDRERKDLKELLTDLSEQEYDHRGNFGETGVECPCCSAYTESKKGHINHYDHCKLMYFIKRLG